MKSKHESWLEKQVVEEVKVINGQEVKVKVYSAKASSYSYEERKKMREEEKKKAKSELRKQGRLVADPRTGEECLVVSGYNTTKSAHRKQSLDNGFVDTGKGYKENKKAWRKLRKEGAAPLEASVNQNPKTELPEFPSNHKSERENKRRQRHRMYCTNAKCVCKKGLSNS